jgi:hypothetical protein
MSTRSDADGIWWSGNHYDIMYDDESSMLHFGFAQYLNGRLDSQNNTSTTRLSAFQVTSDMGEYTTLPTPSNQAYTDSHGAHWECNAGQCPHTKRSLCHRISTAKMVDTRRTWLPGSQFFEPAGHPQLPDPTTWSRSTRLSGCWSSPNPSGREGSGSG